VRAKVFVSPKREVLDPQGKVVETGLHSLGYEKVSGVRVGKYIELDLGDVDAEAAEAKLSEMCERFLANPIVEDYRYELVDDGAEA
jgi:phosphoribosylformylglycinamidine synthase PurS subunit